MSLDKTSFINSGKKYTGVTHQDNDNTSVIKNSQKG